MNSLYRGGALGLQNVQRCVETFSAAYSVVYDSVFLSEDPSSATKTGKLPHFQLKAGYTLAEHLCQYRKVVRKLTLFHIANFKIITVLSTQSSKPYNKL